ncbi:MAG: four helix bundle protein [Patescibacteria group bacterium]|nr:four helix bundle protein [Patescibacteria group bacterium]
MTQSYKDLIVWQKAMDLVVAIYKMTENFPKSELFGITSQIRRSAVSIPSNISEGKMRLSDGEFRQFLKIAYASASELETQIEISKRLQFCNIQEFKVIDELLLGILKMLNRLIYNNLSR